MKQPRRRLLGIMLTAFVAVGVGAGCRSAAPHVAPQEPIQPVGDASPAEALPGSAVSSLSAAEESEALADGPVSIQVDALEEASAVEETDEEDPQILQAEALDLCQSAEEALARGETDEALGAIDRAYELMLALPVNGDDVYLQAKEDIRLLVADLVGRVYRPEQARKAAVSKSWDLGMPIVTNEYVRREIQSFTTVEREAFLRGYQRSGRYRPMILAKLKEAGLPSQLSWLPLVESWFKVRAFSRASAVGMWQFISSTGRRYGLSRDAWIDERFDPEKSTDAAIGYLTDLHGLFGDWPKALAGYNCGEARVQRLQRRSAGEFVDFWDLYGQLPRETRRYVPRLFAAIQIIEDPAKYGMALPQPESPLDGLEVMEMTRGLKLSKLDALLALPKGTLAGLNPELRHKATPRRAYGLRVLAAHKQTLLAKIDTIPQWTPPKDVVHRVRRGETLSVIARRYRTSVRAIMRSNRIRSAHRIWPGQRLRIPVRGTTRTYRSRASRSKVARRADANARRYQVVSGDTLGQIADAHRVSLSALLRANSLDRRSRIFPGQWLAIPK